ncbi:MAG: hypothetical protein FJ297_19205 [Planctomycetes bacterium]|nr:hypothetical protein [Planctomycetota bacterium]
MAGLAKKVDETVGLHVDKKIAAVINFTGEPTDAYLARCAAFATKHGLKHVVIATTNDADLFEVREEAEVTVMHYRNREVQFNGAVGRGGLTHDAIQEIVDGIQSIMN